jgi:hemerythrin
MTQDLRTPADVKKIDIGGGMIHGEAKDFKGDKSKKIILAHVNRSLTTAEKEIGSNASFGQEDILIPAQQDYVRRAAAKYLHRYFPSARSSEIQMLLNCSSRLFNPGYIIQKKGQFPTHVYLVITGVAELIQADLKLEYMLSAGTLIGELDALGGDSTRFTYRTRSYVNVLEIPAELYRPFIQRNANLERIRQIASDMLLLQSTQLFGEMVSSPVLHQVAAQTSRRHLKAGEVISTFDEGLLWMVEEGKGSLFLENKEIEKLSVGEFFGEHSHNPRVPQGKVRVLFTEETQVLTVPLGLLDKIPILEWKMLELCDRRLRICKGK